MHIISDLAVPQYVDDGILPYKKNYFTSYYSVICMAKNISFIKDFISYIKSDSHFPEKNCYFLDWKLFKNDEKCFLFHLKSCYRSQDILVFVASFWSCRKNGLTRKRRLTSKFLTSRPGLQTIVMHTTHIAQYLTK